MDTARTAEAEAIATRVLEALDRDSPQPTSDAGQRTGATPSAASTLTDLMVGVERLAGEVDRLRAMQQHLERLVAELRQQQWSIAACFMRLEKSSMETGPGATRLAQARGFGAGAMLAGGQAESGEWCSVREVAQALGLSQSTVRRYVRQGKLRAVRLPGGQRLRLQWCEVKARLPQVV